MTTPPNETAMLADTIEGWFAGRQVLDPRLLTRWKSSAGGRTIDFECTDPTTAKVAAARLLNSCDAVAEMRLSLLETRAVGWADAGHCESQAQSLSLMHALADRAISAIIPVGRKEDPALWVAFRDVDQTGLVLLNRVAELPPWMVNAPFSLLLHLAFALRGQRLLHAASLGLNGRGALIVGPGGAGKSATTISGLMAGLITVGDDYVVVDFEDPPTARPVYRTLKQSPDGLARLPTVRARTANIDPNWHGKLEFDAELVRSGCIAPELTIEAILIPRQDGGAKTRIEPAPATAGFSALAPSTLSQLPGIGLEGFTSMTRLTRAVPSFWLNLSADPEEVGACLYAFLSRPAG